MEDHKHPPHRNHGLFADHYLENTLPDLPGWDELLEEARSVREKVKELFAGYVRSEIEAQTEKDLIRPVLQFLGHEAFEVQAPLATPGGAKVPDYVLYRGEEALNANKGATLIGESLKGRADREQEEENSA